MFINPIKTADYIQVGCTDAGYFIHATGSNGNVDIPCGTADIAAGILAANFVQHFDYHDSLFNDADETLNFHRACRAIGFEI